MMYSSRFFCKSSKKVFDMEGGMKKFGLKKMVVVLAMLVVFMALLQGANVGTPPCCFYNPDCCQRELKAQGLLPKGLKP